MKQQHRKFTCSNCSYMQPATLDHGSECRRQPPPFPRIDGLDWCGEHSALQGYFVDFDPEQQRIVRLTRILPA